MRVGQPKDREGGMLRLGLALWDLSGEAQPSEEAWAEVMDRMLVAIAPPDQPSE